MEIEEMARMFAKYSVEKEEMRDWESGNVVVFYTKSYRGIMFYCSNISNYEIDRGKAKPFNELCNALDHTQYEGFFIFDENFTEVSNEWEMR